MLKGCMENIVDWKKFVDSSRKLVSYLSGDETPRLQ